MGKHKCVFVLFAGSKEDKDVPYWDEWFIREEMLPFVPCVGMFVDFNRTSTEGDHIPFRMTAVVWHHDARRFCVELESECQQTCLHWEAVKAYRRIGFEVVESSDDRVSVGNGHVNLCSTDSEHRQAVAFRKIDCINELLSRLAKTALQCNS